MIVCPACGAENPGRAKFCMECAAPMAPAVAISEERKTVTTLFCDLVAFTAMSEAADPEDVDRILGDYFARATKVIESHGGTVEKFIGDAVVGVFGVPAVHEDDPERAVRAGLRLLEALEGMTRPDGTPLHARCGVNTGEALVRLDVDPASGRGFLTGDAVNVAARLEAAAPPMGVVVGALTHELTCESIIYRELAPVVAKGKADAVAAWRASGTLARRGIGAHGGELTVLVGREVELAYLAAIFDKVTTQSYPQVALLVGEAGIGKSRLVRELASLADARPQMTTWREGHCPPFGDDVTYWALAEIVTGHAGILSTDQHETVDGKLEAVLPPGSDREWLRQRLRALLGLDAPEASREENFTAWLRFFEEMAAREPTVLVFEDLHWADEALLAFLDHLMTHVASVPLLVVGTARPELFERRPGFASSAGVNRIGLGPLSPAETTSLVAGLLGQSDDCAKAVGEVVQRCDGNPFFAEQSVRLLTDTAMEAPLPDSVQAVIAARLDALPVDQKALLGDAAVVGSVFWDGALAAIGSRSAQALEGMLSGLLERQLVRRIRESSMEGDREFCFVHALARDVAYGQLPRPSRARRHAAVVDWIERKTGERAEDLAELLAHHSLTAVEMAQACGDAELADVLAASAVEHAALAGERAMRLDVQAAKRFFERGLAIVDQGDRGRGRLLYGLGKATSHEGGPVAGLELLHQAADACQREGDVVREARAKWYSAVLLTQMARPGADQLLDEAVQLLGTVPPSRVTLEVLTYKVFSDWLHTEQPAEMLAAANRVIALARELGEPDPVIALSRACLARVELGDPSAVDEYEQLVAIALARGLGDESAQLMLNRGITLMSTIGPERAREALLETIDFAASRGLEDAVISARSGLFETLWLGGEWREALDLLENLTPVMEAAEDVWDLAQTKMQAAFLQLLRGDTPAVESLVGWIAAKELDALRWFDENVLAAKAALQFAFGNQDESREMLSQWVEHRWVVHDASLSVFSVMAMRMALSFSDAKLAGRIAKTCLGNLPLNDLTSRSMNALLAEARGDLEIAVAGFADAVARWHDFGVPYEEAQTLLGQGRCLMALDRASEAAAPLTEAREKLARLGAKPALAEVDRLLASVHVSAGSTQQNE
jgi:class 3 adenylate cyclase